MLFASLARLGQRVQPRQKLAHAAMQRERLLRREGVSRYNKRFRSWTQHRVRQYTLRRPAVGPLSPDMRTKDMDGEYLAASFQKAASLRKMDLEVWRKLANRAMQISDAASIKTDHIGFIFYGIGKTRYLHVKLIGSLLDAQMAGDTFNQLNSHAVMSIMWTLRRTHMHPGEKFLTRISDLLVKEERKFRPKDFFKCLHALAFFGHRKMDADWRSEISKISLTKFEKMFAQEVRALTEPVVLAISRSRYYRSSSPSDEDS
jgi:hypothetical protein